MNASIHLDYFSRKTQRSIRILTYNEEIIGDLLHNQIFIIKDQQDIEKISFNFERDDYFEDQIKYFLDNVENNPEKLI